MSSDRVSDERLAELIAEESEEYAWAIAHPSMASADYPRDYKAALLELQSRRAAEQAALPAVEEMAEMIARKQRHAEECEDHNVRSIVTALYPLYAKLASQAELLGECRERLKSCRHRVEPYLNLSRDVCECIARIDASLVAKGGEDAKAQ